MLSKIAITGFEISTALGDQMDIVWEKLLNNESALKEQEFLKNEKFRFTKACINQTIPFKSNGTRGWEMAESCIEKLIDKSKISFPKNTSVFVGSTLGESSIFEEAATNSEIDTENNFADSWAKKIAKKYDLKGHTIAYGNACAAGNYAVGQAASYMQHFDIDVAIAGASEPFSKIAMVGFNRSRAMSNDYCKPFDKHKNGMVLGEGAAFFLLEKLEHALARGAKIYAIVNSLGLSCDAYHATTPTPDGSGMKKAMQNALKIANIKAEEINWICAHGSGTTASDSAESNAIENLFTKNQPYVSGYKGAFGHTLGAATAIELAICLKGMQENYIPQSTNFTELSEHVNLNMCNKNIKTSINTAMNCGYAFGGINSALIISKYNH